MIEAFFFGILLFLLFRKIGKSMIISNSGDNADEMMACLFACIPLIAYIEIIRQAGVFK